jgi:serine/threonine protein kinase
MKVYNNYDKIIQELSILSTLRHPNVIAFCGMSEDLEDNIYVVTQLAEGGSLESLMYNKSAKNDRMTFKEKMNILLGIADGMTYLHSNVPAILHRDIKPGNVLLHKDGTPLLCDFGLSKFAVNSSSDMSAAVFGTLGYIAPEIYKQEAILDEKCDVYAFGIMMHELFFLEKPYTRLLKDESDRDTTRFNSNISTMKILGGHRPQIPFHMEDTEEMSQWFYLSHKQSTLKPDAIRGYFDLCRTCWHNDPSSRPTFIAISDAIEVLNDML